MKLRGLGERLRANVTVGPLSGTDGVADATRSFRICGDGQLLGPFWADGRWRIEASTGDEAVIVERTFVPGIEELDWLLP